MTFTLTRDSSILLGTVCVFVASVGVYLLVYNNISTMQERYGDVVENLETILAQEKAHNSLATFIANTTNERAELERYMLPRENPTPFLALLERVGDDVGVSITVDTLVEQNMVDTKGTNVAEALYVQSTLSVEGTLTGVNTLLELIESMPYIVLVDRVVMAENASDGVWGGQIHVRVAVR